jgi:hypothetical protein
MTAQPKTHRIARPIIAELLKRCLLPDRDILGAAVWLRDLVMRDGAPLSRVGRGRGLPIRRKTRDLAQLLPATKANVRASG